MRFFQMNDTRLISQSAKSLVWFATLLLVLSVFFLPAANAATDPIKDALAGCGVITFDSDAQGFRTASTRENRTVNSGPFNAPHVSGANRFQWEATGGNPAGHVRADDLDGEYQEVWTPAFTDFDFSALNGQQLQFDYRNDTGYNQFRLYIEIVGNNGRRYYYYFNNQLGSPGSWSRVKVPMVASAWHTGFEAGENPSTPPDSPAPDSTSFANVLNNLSRIAISVEGVQGADISRFDNFGRACDWGDLPETGASFVTTGANAARHNISDTIRLGALIDTEPTGQPTTAADGDDANFSDDEDGIATLPLLPIATANYSLPVAVTNTTGNPATLYGWIDLDGNGRFEPAELQTATVPGNGAVTTATLTWPNVRVATGATLYARLRFTTFLLNEDTNTPADERAQGIASDGEVEDYLLSAAPLGSLTVIKNAVGSNDSFSFNTTGLSPTNFTLTTVGGTAQRTFPNLLPGFYSVTELLSPAWDLTGATCSDGSPVTNIALALSENVTCTFTNQIPSYSVNATVSGGFGSVSCTPASVTRGGSGSCTAVPDAGSRVLAWGGDCAAAGSNVQCSLTNILANKISTVSFAPIPTATYNVTATVVGGSFGSVGCFPSSVKAGDSSTCIAVALTGFRVLNWGGACAAAGSNVQCTLTNIQADQASTVSFELTPPATYNVTATVIGGNYGSVGCFPNSVKAGENSTCIAAAYAGFRVKNWGGACASAGSNSTCSLSKIQADQVSTVSFELTPPATYNVTATVIGGSHGSVGCYPSSVKAGESSTCIAVAYAGFQVQSWGGACATSGSNAQCVLTNLQSDQSSTVSFVALPAPTYSISATVSGGNGTVSCTPSPVPQGDSSSCTAMPDAGYQVAAWTGDCAASGQNVHCALSNIQRDQSSTVSFAAIPPNSYHVSASALLGHGNVSCTPNTVTSGGSSTCTAVPEAGYQITAWSGACAAAGHNAQCTLSKIKADQTSTVSFAPLPPATYTVSATVSAGNGHVSCAPGTVTAGGSSSCTAVPDAGYAVQSWTGACAASGSNAQCDLSNIQANQSSTVRFVALSVPTFTISATVTGGNGAVSCSPSLVPQGDSSGCTAVPDPGYQIAAWTGACAATGHIAHCALSNIQSNQTSTVRFEIIPPNSYSVTATVALGHGSVSCTPGTVTAGGSSACSAVPEAGYQVHDWSGDCAATGSQAQCHLTNIRTNQVSTVSFTPLLPATYTISAIVTGGNGTVGCNPTRVAKGGQSTCTAIPATGDQVQDWSGDCAAAGSNVQCYLPKIQKNQTSTVRFAAIPPGDVHIVALVVGGNGTVSCTPANVPVGGNSTCTATPDAGYQVAHWDGACLLTGQNAQCNLTNLQTDLTSTVTFESTRQQTPQQGAVSGVVFNDLNGNRVQEVGEPGIAGVIVQLLDNAGAVVRTTTTAANGSYSFSGVTPGAYTVRETDSNGFTSTTPNTVPITVVAGGTASANFGDRQQTPQQGAISGIVFNDINGNGVQETGEPGIGGVTLTLKDSQGVTVALVTTASDGRYAFTGVTAGNYQIVETDPAGYASTTANAVPVTVTAGGTVIVHFGDQINAADLRADALLFPYFAVSDTVTSMVSVINRADQNGATIPRPQTLHYRIYSKNGANADNLTAPCEEFDVRRVTSPNDVVTFDLTGHYGDRLGVLAEPADRQAKANYAAQNQSFAFMKGLQPARGFLVVDNNEAPNTSFEPSLAGDLMVIDFSGGAAWGYPAYNAAPSDTSAPMAYNFEDAAERMGEVLAGNRAITPTDLNGGASPSVPVNLLPFASATTSGGMQTRFLVTPIGHSVTFPAGTTTQPLIESQTQLRSDLTTQIRLQVAFATGDANDVMFDRDENPVSGQAPQNVTCVGAVNVETLLSAGALREIGEYGGWSGLEVRSPGALASLSTTIPPSATRTNNTNQATVIKLEFSPDGRFLGESFKGSFNNALWLRRGIRESVFGTGGGAPGVIAPRLRIRSAADGFGYPVDVANDFVRDSLGVSQ